MKKILLSMLTLMAAMTTMAQNKITFTTARAVGETIQVAVVFTEGAITVEGATVDGSITSDVWTTLTLTSQTVTLTGDATYLNLRNQEITSIDASACTTLTALFCEDNHQLTSLKVPDVATFTQLVFYNNGIRGDAMTTLIDGLPTVSGGSLVPLIEKLDANENAMTVAQVAAAKAKGWTDIYNYYGYEYIGDGEVDITMDKEYASYCSISPLDFSTVEGLEAYVVSDVNASKVILTKVTEVPRMTGVILKKTGSATIYTVPAGTATTLSSTNLLKTATYSPSVTPVYANNAYVLSNGKFCLLTTYVDFPIGKAYLPASEVPAGSNELSFDLDDGTTGIQRLTPILSEGVYYDLSGRRVLAPKKGLYIMNGKKYIIK